MTDTATSLPFTLANHDDAPTRGGSSLDAMPCCGSLDLRLADCMDVMKTFADGHFDLAVVDPPYGIGEDGGKLRTKRNRPNSYLSQYKHAKKGWDIKPSADYFAELMRVSKHQIIWGGNFFVEEIAKNSSCWIMWDKNIGGDQADGELAWTSFKTAIRKFFGHPFVGTCGGKDRIHPTQKPVDLYKWIFAKYAAPGQRVLDTHLGSGSIAIAAHYAGIHLTACEIDPDYFHAAKARIARETSQAELFIHHNAEQNTPPNE